jgi:hypothetical protein
MEYSKVTTIFVIASQPGLMAVNKVDVYNNPIIFTLSQSATTKIPASCHHLIENRHFFPQVVPATPWPQWLQQRNPDPHLNTKILTSLKSDLPKGFSQTKSQPNACLVVTISLNFLLKKYGIAKQLPYLL